jgi:hypothetical protein
MRTNAKAPPDAMAKTAVKWRNSSLSRQRTGVILLR